MPRTMAAASRGDHPLRVSAQREHAPQSEITANPIARCSHLCCCCAQRKRLMLGHLSGAYTTSIPRRPRRRVRLRHWGTVTTSKAHAQPGSSGCCAVAPLDSNSSSELCARSMARAALTCIGILLDLPACLPSYDFGQAASARSCAPAGTCALTICRQSRA